MKKLFFTLCALCLCGTMWAAVTDVNAYKDSDRPENSTNEIYVDQTTGLSFYINSNGEAVITYVNDWTADGVTTSNWTSGYAINGTLTIPEQVSADGSTYYSVTKIGASAFVSDTTISGTLTIPATITTIGAAAFSFCTGIETVIFEESDVPLVDECATSYYSMFYNAVKVSKVEMYRNLSTNYGNQNCAPFSYQSALAEVILGEKITSLPNYMFRSYYNTGALAKVTSYAENPPTLGTSVFDRHADGVTLYTPYDYVNNYRLDSDWYSVFGNEIHSLSGEDPDWPTDELAFEYDGLWYEPIYEEDGVTETGEAQIIADQGGAVYEGTITIPETATNSETSTTYTVTRIDEGAFENSNISGEVVIPANILNMGKQAFHNCTGIKTVTYEYSPTPLYEENTTNNSEGSFQGCNQITTVNIYRDITLSGNNLYGPFVGLGTVQTINIGPRVTSIPTYMFRNSSATTATTAINCYAVEPPELGTGPFGVLSSSCVAYVPQGSEADYQSSSWTTQYSTLTIQEMSNAFAITTHENGEGTAYATFYNGAANVELFDGTLTAYEATTLEDEGLVIDIVEIGNVIPKATGVVVETATEGTYLAIATENEAGSATNNHLYGSDTATPTVAPGEGSYLYYLLSSYNDVVGFYWGAANGGAFQCQAHRAYLAIEQGNGSQGISIRKGNGGEDTTGISSVESASEGASVKGIYTIQGVRVSNMNQPGLYIVDGKKVLVK